MRETKTKEIRTTMTKDGVLYEVIAPDGTTVLWSKFVRFGRTKRFRAGGPAFREAAAEQERQALLDKEKP